MPAAARQASAGIVDRLVVVVMRHVMMRVVRQMMMMRMVMRMVMMSGSGRRAGNQRRHADNNGQSRENLTH